MIDITNVATFTASIPKVSSRFSDEFYITMRTPKSIKTTTKNLTRKGYLGCLPFAHHKNDRHSIIRLLPETPLSQCPTAYVWNKAIEGLTEAPSIQYFVAALIAQYDIADPDFNRLEKVKEPIFEFADAMQGTEPCQRIFDALEELTAQPDSTRSWQTLKAANPNDPLIAAIYGAQCIYGKDIVPWLKTLSPEAAALQVTKRRELTYHIAYKTGGDISEPAAHFIMGDDVFDPQMSSGLSSWNHVDRDRAPLVWIVNWLLEHANTSFGSDSKTVADTVADIVPECIWQAVSAFAASPNTYTGELHFEAAELLKETSPIQAYTLLANGAAYYGRVTREAPMRAITQAYELAKNNHWDDIALTLKWALE